LGRDLLAESRRAGLGAPRGYRRRPHRLAVRETCLWPASGWQDL